MSFQDNPGQQISFEDRYLALPAQVQKIVDRSWARDFAEIVFPCIDEKRFSVLYDQGKGTSNSPINVTVGGLMLKKKPKMNSIKKSAGKALHAAGNFVENMPKW